MTWKQYRTKCERRLQLAKGCPAVCAVVVSDTVTAWGKDSKEVTIEVYGQCWEEDCKPWQREKERMEKNEQA